MVLHTFLILIIFPNELKNPDGDMMVDNVLVPTVCLFNTLLMDNSYHE